MSTDLNRVILIGRLTADPQLRYTPAGTAVAGFSLANNKTYNQGGEKKDQVSYFPCIAWSKLGEIMTEHCKKGMRISVDGRLQQRRWADQDGKNRSAVEVIVENFQFLNDKKADNPAPGDKGISGMGTEVPGDMETYPMHGYDEDPDKIPF